MTTQDESNYFGDTSRQYGEDMLAGSVSKRNLVILTIDTSQSMTVDGGAGRSRIDELNDAIQAWLPRVHSATELRDAEIAVITFGSGGVRVVQANSGVQEHEDGGAFVPAQALTLPRFDAGGVTPMVAAIERALDLGRRRATHLAATRNLQSGRLRVITMSDGVPTDDQGKATNAWEQVAARLRRMRQNKEVLFFAFGVGGAAANVMRGLAGDDGFYKLSEIDFKKLLDLVLIASSADDPYESLRRVAGRAATGT